VPNDGISGVGYMLVTTSTLTALATATATAVPTPTATPVAGLRGDANCDGRLSAADPTALLVTLATGDGTSCGLEDANGDGQVDADDVGTVIEVLTVTGRWKTLAALNDGET
jgi:hypothetical protein